MKTFLRRMLSHKGRMYELFYWVSKGTDWMNANSEIKNWIDDKEYEYWRRWVTK